MVMAGVDVFFEPKAVAVVGASPRPDNMGRAILENLLAGFKGRIFVVNPRYDQVLGLRSYRSVKDVGEAVDVAVIATPAELVPQVVEESGEAGVKGVIIFSGGFAETGTEEGKRLQDEVVRISRKYGVRVVGPNCIGVYNYSNGFDTFFLPRDRMRRPRPGPIAIVSQSGALLATMMDWAASANIGVSRAINFGNKVDVDEVEALEYLLSQDDVKAVLLYIEGVTRGRELRDLVRKAVSELDKPVIVVKGGKTSAGSRATLSHTASIAGNYGVFVSSMESSGAIVVDDVELALRAANALAKMPHGPLRRVAVITNSGGHGVLATDALVSAGVEVPEPSEKLAAALREAFPLRVSVRNPFDLTGSSTPRDYERLLGELAKSGEYDSYLIVALVQPPTMDADEVTKVVSSFRDAVKGSPVVVVTMGSGLGELVAKALEERGVPTFPLPDKAAQVMAIARRYYETRARLATAEPYSRPPGIDYGAAAEVLRSRLESGVKVLPLRDSLRLLELYGIPVARHCAAYSREEAARCFREVGPRVVLKLESPEVVHKSDVGGVILGVEDEAGAVRAYDELRTIAEARGLRSYTIVVQEAVRADVELMVGGLRDPAFGPIVTFGAGGLLAELLRDFSARPAPVSRSEALEMIRSTRVFGILRGYRNIKPVNLDRLADIIVRTSTLLADHPEIEELDINPILAHSDLAIAVDARVVLSGGD